MCVHGHIMCIYLCLQGSCWCRSWWAVESRRVYSSNAPGWYGQDWASLTSDSTSWPFATFTQVRHTDPPMLEWVSYGEDCVYSVTVCLFSDKWSHVTCWTDLFLWLTLSWLSQNIHRKATVMAFFIYIYYTYNSGC